ncbi:MAG TPA: rod shape-determining protein MreC, partial [Leptospiraceae bacterium]|nr:rod shape-determining protein MreC [Leptospiraceae bacterium]
MIWQRNPLARTVGFFGKVADRASGAMNSGLSATGRFWVEIDKFRELEKRYAQAEKQIEEYKLEKDKFDALKKENDTLRKTLGFAIPAEFPEVRAEVLGVRLNSISPRVIIGKGEETGIRPFMPVIARSHDADNNTIRSVVGIVVSADNGTSVVQPLIHPGFQLGVRLPDSGAWAMLSGNSGNPTQALLTVISGDGSLDGKKPIGQ